MSIYIGTGPSGLHQITSSVNDGMVKRIITEEFSPEIGAVKYLARRNPVAVDVSAADFDGWVYADGARYSGSDFPSAARVFGGSSTFAVPDLRRFAKPQPSQTGICAVQASASVPSHAHNVNTTIRYTQDHVITAAFMIAQTGCGTHVVGKPGANKLVKLTKDNYKAYVDCDSSFDGYVPGLHGGANKTSAKDHQVMTDLNIPTSISFAAVGTGNTGSSSPDGYPDHVELQVMVYIGRRGA